MPSDKQKNINDFISRIRDQKKAPVQVDVLFEELKAGDKKALSKAITLVESKRSEDIVLAHQLLQKCLPIQHTTRRIGITGIPGSGKSTYINTYALALADAGKKVAILSIDPSSSVSHGSILGDKTRMEDIAHLEQVFIRPTATGNTLGGVHLNTREVILLCEAAGYDFILVETVGVGQSEYVVQDMTDILLLLLLPGSGDALQGIKRGIMEAADVVLINKADQFAENNIQRTVADYKHAIHMMPMKENGWSAKVMPSSALDKTSVSEISEVVDTYFRHIHLKGQFDERRMAQWRSWYLDSISWATNEVLKQKGIDLFSNMPTDDELPPAKALATIKKLIG